MVRKRWRLKSTMLVPATWQGSVQHFYHYFLGYFVPTVLWQEDTGATEFTVRECGPMQSWFDLLRPGTEVNVLPAGVMFQRYLSHSQEYRVFHGWDDPTRFHRASLQRFAKVIQERQGVTAVTSTNNPRRITVIDRRPSVDFYLSDASETFESAAGWRSLPNMSAIAESLKGLGQVTLIDAAALSPAEQVAVFSATDVLVAQHGAGLSSQVWMSPGSAVVEIQPPLMPQIAAIFSNLAATCGLDYTVVAQPGEHDPVDVDSVLRGTEQVLAAAGSAVPRMAGSLPTRLVRQLPRRW